MIKYPRTLHLPWSNWTNKDKVLKSISCFRNKRLIITEKMDGECTSMTKDSIWARSVDSIDHESQHWVKGLWGNIKHLIPENMIICGENMYAKHSIYYDDLQSYFLVFNIWMNNVCLSWEETEYWCNKLSLTTVPILEKSCKLELLGLFSRVWSGNFPNRINWKEKEGYVVRNIGSFMREDFDTNVAKYVRPNHVQTDVHWKDQPMIKNKLKSVNNV